MEKITIKNQIINVKLSNKGYDYISLTDIAKYKNKAGYNSFTLSPQKKIGN